MNSRHIFNGASLVGVLTALFFFARLILSPDPGADFFTKAQRLEAAGQIPLALRHYQLVSSKTPESLFAPRALLRQGDLLAAQGRQKADKSLLKQAVAAYAILAKNYSTDTLAGEALFDAAEISTDLKEFKPARGFYEQILKNNSPKSDASALATLKIARLALVQNDRKTAQTLFQRVLQQWPRNAQIGAEAQFHLGVTYETLFKNRDWATRAYDATIARYPLSIWANNARGRLGLLAFADTKGRRPARRVRIDVAPFVDEGVGSSDASEPWNALRPLLASRGMEVDDPTLRAWSLTPFWLMVDKRNPGRVVQPSFDAFENVVANAGLKFTIKGGGRENEALADLKNDIDAAHTILVWSEIDEKGAWNLVVGYDSERDEVMLQSGGARFETLASKTFAAGWKAPSKFGKSYTLLSFFSDDERKRPKPQLTPTPEPSPKPGATPLPIIQAPPTFVWKLPRLNRRDAHRATLRRAANLVTRAGNEYGAQGSAGLDFLSRELALVARAPRAVELVPTPQAPIDESADVPARAETLEESPDGFVDETPTPETTTAPAGELPRVETVPAPRVVRNQAPRAKQLVAFFGEPARQWASKRRECASWCAEVANQLNDKQLQNAARAWERSAQALESAMNEAPLIDETLSAENRADLRELSRLMATARDAEREAARLMNRD